MRFELEYTDFADESTNNRTVLFLNAFLNFHLIDHFHGWTYDCIYITLQNNAPARKKEGAKKHLDQYAKVTVNGAFKDNKVFNLPDFRQGLQLVRRAAQHVDLLPVEGKDYDVGQLISDLDQLEAELPEEEAALVELYGQMKSMEAAFQIKRVDAYLKACKAHPMALNTKFEYVEIWDHFGQPGIHPYGYMYSEIFSTLLRNEYLMTPHYKIICLGIARTMDEAKKNSPLYVRYWQKYSYATLDIEAYNNATEELKEKMVFRSICYALRLIADIDHLDKEKIEKVISHVEKKGVNTVLTYRTEENRHFKVAVTYSMLPDHTQPIPFYLSITDKKTLISNTVLINNFIPYYAPYSFGKIVIKNDEVIIRSKGGIRGEINRSSSGLPDEHRFLISAILNTPAQY